MGTGRAMNPSGQIVAMGGGQWPGDPVYRFIFDLTGAARPKVLSVPATGDNDRSVAAFFRAFPAGRWEPSVLALFERTVRDLRSCAIARRRARGRRQHPEHARDLAGARPRPHPPRGVGGRRRARQRQRWRELLVRASTTVLLGRADPFRTGSGWCPAASARTSTLSLRGAPGTGGSWARVLPPGIACDDLAAVHILGTEVAEVVVSDRDAGARRVAPGAHGDVETPFETRILEGTPS